MSPQRRKVVKLTNKMLLTLSHALDILSADYPCDGETPPPYRVRMQREIEVVRRALTEAK